MNRIFSRICTKPATIFAGTAKNDMLSREICRASASSTNLKESRIKNRYELGDKEYYRLLTRPLMATGRRPVTTLR